ncbi:hypothetical protein G6F31_018993 [Rhizopus arrhizus]|nr:hypothetical protein G6F31_018993 [Rhizopus arrhizus]KAG1386438.1 hypothetical protein G6F59_016860 [Rhizopus arrhizus]
MRGWLAGRRCGWPARTRRTRDSSPGIRRAAGRRLPASVTVMSERDSHVTFTFSSSNPPNVPAPEFALV